MSQTTDTARLQVTAMKALPTIALPGRLGGSNHFALPVDDRGTPAREMANRVRHCGRLADHSSRTVPRRLEVSFLPSRASCETLDMIVKM